MLKVLLVVLLFAWIPFLSYQKPMDGERPVSPVDQDISWSDLEDLFPLDDANSIKLPTSSNPLQSQSQSPPSHRSGPAQSPKDSLDERMQEWLAQKRKQRRERYAKNKAEHPDDFHAAIQEKNERIRIKLANMTKEQRAIASAKRAARAKIARQKRKERTGFMTKS
ncbi:uncharacterized protein FA14DRAFT_152106 [Meira miltonrushii]|uniref:BZIP domain-containing protein n=1 Tax=Meira miltonrushii TaxID=1280837 RepID=A0A316VGC3_9BASI|nr:uncharacterized protein FA14DRAFT_152106 [Meira miltonrushii]PWN36679.1 hypothetical protein FA14DRAFT_152106 [Meira miltonrushii]